MRIRFRRRAARYSGKMRGPNLLRSLGNEMAGWCGERVRPVVNDAVASLIPRGRRYSLICGLLVDRNFIIGVSPSASTSAPAWPSLTLFFCQYSSSMRRRSAFEICSLHSISHSLVLDQPSPSYFASSSSPSACRQLFPSLPETKGTNAPTANICAFRCDLSAGTFTNALMPA